MSDQSTAIRAGLAANLAALSSVQVSKYVLGSPTPPFAMVDEGEIEYDEAMGGGLDMLVFVVVVGVQFTTDLGSQVTLDALRDPLTGIKHVVESDATLGGACDYCVVTKASKPQVRKLDGGTTYLGCDFTVEVYAPRSL